MYKYQPIHQYVKEMTSLAKHLIPYSYPFVSMESEKEVDILKKRTAWCDGHRLLLYFSISQFGLLSVKTLEIAGLNSPFLPMSLVCKITQEFVGNKNVTLSTKFKLGREVYMWTTVEDKEGKVIPLRYEELELRRYDNFTYFV